MLLVVAFAAAAGGAVLLTMAVSGASFADVLAGRANTSYKSQATGLGGGGATSATSPSAAGAGTATAGGYLNPLSHASSIGRTDQGVDFTLAPGAPIPAPGKVKILGIVQDFYHGQPAVFYQLLDGPDAGKVQYVAEQITQIASPGQILQQGQPIAVGAQTGTGGEFGWGTTSLQTLAQATTGYVEGQVTTAGSAIRKWLGL